MNYLHKDWRYSKITPKIKRYQVLNEAAYSVQINIKYISIVIPVFPEINCSPVTSK